MTLRQLAEAVGTTPQSVSRLETGNMTLSTEWLERFAGVLRVHPVDLLEGPGSRDIRLVGHVTPGGEVRMGREQTLTIDIPAENPVAVRLDAGCGPYRAGEVLIGDRLAPDALERAWGRDCIIAASDDRLMLMRLLNGENSPPASGANGQDAMPNGHGAAKTTRHIGQNGPKATLVSLDQSAPSLFDTPILWAAPLIMRLAYV